MRSYNIIDFYFLSLDFSNRNNMIRFAGCFKTYQCSDIYVVVVRDAKTLSRDRRERTFLVSHNQGSEVVALKMVIFSSLISNKKTPKYAL